MQDVTVLLILLVLIGKVMKEKCNLKFHLITCMKCFGEDNELNAVDVLVNMYRNPTDVQLIGVIMYLLTLIFCSYWNADQHSFSA